MTELSEYVPVNLISLCILGALLLGRLVRADGCHRLRVFILTGLLWAVLIVLCLMAFAAGSSDCVPMRGGPEDYSVSGTGRSRAGRVSL